MNKQQFLSDLGVQEFRNWFISKVDAGFSHQYCIIPKGQRPVSESWACTSIYNAFERYSWSFSYTRLIGNRQEVVNGTTFADSKRALEEIEAHLKASIANESETEAFQACKMVLDWGGVLSRGQKGKTNEDKLTEIKNTIGLVNYLSQAKALLELDAASTTGGFKVIGPKNNSSVLLMNSGFTKIYSILVDNFVIYDGRVGAGLGLLVSQFKSQLPSIRIDELMFAYGNAAKSDKCLNNNSRRNPSRHQVKFPNIFQGQNQDKKRIKHIQNNLKASWLIESIIENLPKNSEFLNEPNSARALEAALFMIGNCVHVECTRNQCITMP